MSSFIRALRKSGLKHKKLCEEWSESREPVLDGVTFYVKYVGSCIVDQAKGERSTANAIKTIATMSKTSGKKLDRVAFQVSPKGVQVVDQVSQQKRLEIPIYKISYCSADAYYDHIFAFITVNKNETLECHAFLCPKKKVAHAVTLTIAQAFNIAFEMWKNSREEHIFLKLDNGGGPIVSTEGPPPSSCDEQYANGHHRVSNASVTNGHTQHVLLIDFGDDDTGPPSPKRVSPPWNLEDDFNWNGSFEKFIEARYYLPTLDTNLSSDSMPDLRHYLVSEHHLQESNCFPRDESCDLLSL